MEKANGESGSSGGAGSCIASCNMGSGRMAVRPLTRILTPGNFLPDQAKLRRGRHLGEPMKCRQRLGDRTDDIIQLASTMPCRSNPVGEMHEPGL